MWHSRSEALGTLLEGCGRLESSNDVFTVWQLAKAWALYGNFSDDEKALRKAEELLLQVPENELTNLGKAALLLDLARVLRDREKYRDAAHALRRSLELDPTTVTKIHLAHALALSSETDQARELQLELGREDVDETLRLEYFAAKASLAIATNDIGFAREIIDGLKQLTIEHPFWREQRDQLIIEMFDFVSQATSVRPATRQRSILKLLLSANEILEVKPRLFGVGVNVNKVIEKVVRRFDYQ
jgi:tetratricopeptide (TPR) repeat protein